MKGKLIVSSFWMLFFVVSMKAQSNERSPHEADRLLRLNVQKQLMPTIAHVHDMRMMMQSPGCSGYSFGTLGYQLLTPSEEAASGRVAATINVTSVDSGGIASHNLTQTTNDKYTVRWSSQNVPSGATATFTVPQVPTSWSVPLNGPQDGWTTQTNPGPETFVFTVYDSKGNVLAHDRITVTGVSGTIGKIADQDAVPTNRYARFNPNFGGGAMAQTCQICIQQPSACAGAQHTPYMTASITNNTTGETRSLPRQVAGSVVDENSPISGSLFIPDISVVPGDDLSGNVTGEIFCSAEADNIWNQFLSWRVEYGKTVVKDLGHPPRYNAADKSYLYDVAPICDNNSDPADWQPTVVHSWAGRHTYWFGVTSLLRWPDVPAAKWIPAADIMVDWTTSGPFGGVIDLLKMAVEGGAVPYPGGSGPDFPVPGACTRFVGFDSHTGKPYYNVILTLGSGDLPWWPQLN